MRQTLLLLALLCQAAPTLAQEPRFPWLLAQPVQTPPPPPPSEPTPPKPRTATPAEDTGMAGQVAGAAGLGAGLGLTVPVLLGVIVAATVAAVANTDNTAPSSATTTTGTR